MSWSKDYKKSIDCDNPKGFSQRAHCAARKKRERGEETKSKSPFSEMMEHCGCEDVAVQELESGLKKLDDISYDSIDKLMRRIMKKHDMTAKQLHNAFVDKHNKTPDAWIKNLDEGTLHHWFKGSKSKTGKPGWVQADGSPCANEPGETKTPKCFSSGRLKALKRKGKKGEALIRSAVRRKRQKDKGQQAKSGAAAPTNVATFAKGKKDPNYIKAEPGIKETMEINEARKDKPGKGSGTKDACYHKVKARYDVWPSAYASGALVKCRKVGADNWGTKTEEALNYDWHTPIRERPDRYCPKCEKLELRHECRYGPRYWDLYSVPAELIKDKQDYSITAAYPGPETTSSNPPLSLNQMKYSIATVHPANEAKDYKDHEHSMARSELSTVISAVRRLQKKMKGEGNIEAWVQSKITKAADYLDSAADYLDSGESDVDESIVVQDSNGNDYVEFTDIIKPEPLKPSRGIGSELLDEAGKKCWPGYKKKGTQKLFGKTYNRCVKEGYSNWRNELKEDLQKNPEQLDELWGKVALAAGATALPYLVKKLGEKPVNDALDKSRKTTSIGGDKRVPQMNSYEPKEDVIEDWQKVNRQDKTDGLSQAAVDAYRRENPGSKLQTAVTEKNPKGKRAKRRANFCRRMKGMKSKLTSAETARDPDSRINKALRRWNCN